MVTLHRYTGTMKEKIESSPIRQEEQRVIFFAALCLFLSVVEYAIPKPLPFLRLGLANLPVLLSFPKLRKKNIVLLVFMKTVGQGLISGTLFSYVFVFSAAGSFASALGMGSFYYLFVYKKSNPVMGFVGLSLIGALCNTATEFITSINGSQRKANKFNPESRALYLANYSDKTLEDVLWKTIMA